MPKYTAVDLKARAQIFLQDHEAKGDKAFHLIMALTMLTGMSPEKIVWEIRKLT